MTTEAFIIVVFCDIDDRMPNEHKHPQARLCLSELVAIGVLLRSNGDISEPSVERVHVGGNRADAGDDDL